MEKSIKRELYLTLPDPIQNIGNITLREDVWPLLHIIQSKVISLDNLEPLSIQNQDLTQLQVPLAVLNPGDRILVRSPLQVLPALNTRVSSSDQIHLNSVISAEEGHNELPIIILSVLAQHPSLESEDELVLVEHLVQVLWRSLPLEREAVLEGVSLGAVSVVRRDWVVEFLCGFLGQRDWLLGEAEFLSVVPLGELIAVEDQTVSVVDLDVLPAEEVLRGVVLLLLQGHSWVVSQEWLLWDLAASEEEREGVFARVLLSDLLHLDSVISQEIVHFVEVNPSAKSPIIPHNIKTEHMPIVLQVLLESSVGVSSAELLLVVLLVLLEVRWVDFEVFDALVVVEVVTRDVLSGVELEALLLEEGSGELIAVGDSEGSLEEGNVGGEVEVSPVEVVSLGSDDLWDLLTLDEDALGDSGVHNPWLVDMDGVVAEVVVDEDSSDPVVFERRLID